MKGEHIDPQFYFFYKIVCTVRVVFAFVQEMIYRVGTCGEDKRFKELLILNPIRIFKYSYGHA